MRHRPRRLAALTFYLTVGLTACGVGKPPIGTDGGGAERDSGGMQDDSSVSDDAAVIHDGGPAKPCTRDLTVFPNVLVYDVAKGAAVGSDLGTTRVTISGSVTGQGEGNLPAEAKTAASGAGFEPTATRWLRLTEASGAGWIVLTTRVPHDFGVSDGSAVSLRYLHYFGGFDAERDSLELSVAGQLAFYFGRDATASGFELPASVSTSRGAELCKQESDCGDYALYELDVTIDGDQRVFGTDEQHALGAYDVWHGRTAEQLGSGGGCADWFVSDSTFTLARHEPLFEAPGSSCLVSSTSSLPGVHIELDTTQLGDCNFTLAQAMAGLTFDYHVVIDDEVAGVLPYKQDAGGCAPEHASGLYLGEVISGGNQHYCVCDEGLCAPETPAARTLIAGSYPGSFAWDGHNWDGPSDTGNPKGPLFPAGTYTFEVKTTGNASAGDFLVRAALTFTLK